MTVPVNTSQEAKPNDKELNFRNLEARYERQLAQEREARMNAEKQLQERSKQNDDEDDSEPYVDHKKLEKKLARHSEQNRQQTKNDIQEAVNNAVYEERKNNWLKQNSDFHEVLQHAEKFAQAHPDLADTILEMPEGFERQKLVYKNIKTLGLHKESPKEPSIQEKIDSNRRSPFYQPAGVGTAPYQSTGDFSESGQKQAFQKMQELKSRLRI